MGTEFALGRLPPMEAIDQLILVQSCLKDTFARHGYLATMATKPIAGDTVVTEQHMHLSLHPARTEHQEPSFLAGVLGHLSSLCSFCLPLDTSS